MTLGLDLSIRSTGWALLDGARLVAYGHAPARCCADVIANPEQAIIDAVTLQVEAFTALDEAHSDLAFWLAV